MSSNQIISTWRCAKYFQISTWRCAKYCVEYFLATWRPSPTTACQSNIQIWGSVGRARFPRSRKPAQSRFHQISMSSFSIHQKIKTFPSIRINRTKHLRPALLGRRCSFRAQIPTGQSRVQLRLFAKVFSEKSQKF